MMCQGVEYYQCTYADSPKAWCATGVDSSNNVITNRWDHYTKYLAVKLINKIKMINRCDLK